MPTTADPDPARDPRNEPSGDLPSRRFGWWDMFVHPDEDPRTDGGFQGERATLVGYLRDQRLTLELKCSGLDAAELAHRSVAPSNLPLLGLVRHLAEVERAWFRRRMAGLDAPRLYSSEADPDGDFDGAVPDPRWSRRPGPPGGPRSGSRSGTWPRRQISTSSARRATCSARCWCT